MPQPFSPQLRGLPYAQRHAARLYGEPGGPLLVLSHGFGSNQDVWAAQVAHLAPRFSVLTFDLAGCGDSDLSVYSPLAYPSLYAFAEDLLEICAELTSGPVVYVGHSVSGMIGLLASQLYPGRFSQIIAIAASACYRNLPGYQGGLDQADLDAMFAAMSTNYQAWAAGFGRLAIGNPDRPELGNYFAGTLAALQPDFALAIARTIFGSDHRDDLAGVRVPVTLLQSREDIAVPFPAADYLAAHIPEARFRILDASGHLPHVSAPAEVNREIDAALAAVGRRQPHHAG